MVGGAHTGIGVQGHGVTGGSIGVQAHHVAGGTALEINNGSLKVAGPVRAAFEHYDTTPGINCTLIDHPLTNDDPFALLFATPTSGIAAYVQFQGNKWAICGVFGTLVSDVLFNVLVIKQ